MKKYSFLSAALLIILSFAACAVPSKTPGNNDTVSQADSSITVSENTSTEISSSSESNISSALAQDASSSKRMLSKANASSKSNSSSQASSEEQFKIKSGIIDISAGDKNTMFLHSNGNVYMVGADIYRKKMFTEQDDIGSYKYYERFNYKKPTKVFSNAKSICTRGWEGLEYNFGLYSIIDRKGNYYVMGSAPDDKVYNKFTHVMSNVKKAGKGLILKDDNTLYIWGVFQNEINPIFKLTLNAKTPQLFIRDIRVYYGTNLSGYAITTNGDLYAWGITVNGFDNKIFKPFKLASNIREVGYNCFITNKNELYKLEHDQFASCPQYQFFAPVKVADNIKTASFVNVSLGLSYYITTSNSLYMWGSYYHHELEHKGDIPEIKTPQKVADNIAQATLGCPNIYLDRNGNLTTFGCNDFGRLGIGNDNIDYYSNNKNVILKNIVRFYQYNSTFIDNNYAINENGEVYCWGACKTWYKANEETFLILHGGIGDIGTGYKNVFGQGRGFVSKPTKVVFD